VSVMMQQKRLNPQNEQILRGRLSADRQAVTTVIESAKAAQSTTAGDPLWHREQGELLDHARKHLDEVNVALGKLTDGVYGQCQRCGAQLSLSLLEAMPFASRCVLCAPAVGA
jgi:DnaK suppressor protein